VSITGSNYQSAFTTLVKRINFYRSIFGSPNFASNAVLNKYAQSRAFLYASSGRFGVPNSIFNESIYFDCASDVSDITRNIEFLRQVKISSIILSEKDVKS
jgi:hypothetical protein